MKNLKVYLLVLLSVCLVFSACSTTSSSDSPEEGEENTVTSGADAVDDEELFGEDSDSETDPFAELDEAANSDGVSESGDEAMSAISEMPSEVSGGGGSATYVVRKGDTLMKIAFSIYGDVDKWKDIFNMNRSKLNRAGAILVGMQLVYDQPSQMFQRRTLPYNYLIKRGDSLGSISKEIYGKINKWRKLYNYNRDLIKNPNIIFAGFTLYYDITKAEMDEAQRIKNSLSYQDSGEKVNENASIAENELQISPEPEATTVPQPLSQPTSKPVAVAPTSVPVSSN